MIRAQIKCHRVNDKSKEEKPKKHVKSTFHRRTAAHSHIRCLSNECHGSVNILTLTTNDCLISMIVSCSCITFFWLFFIFVELSRPPLYFGCLRSGETFLCLAAIPLVASRVIDGYALLMGFYTINL